MNPSNKMFKYLKIPLMFKNMSVQQHLLA